MRLWIEKVLSILCTLRKLGVFSVLSVYFYKLSVKVKLHPVIRIKESSDLAPLFVGYDCFDLAEYDYRHFFFFDKRLSELDSFIRREESNPVFLTNWFNGFVFSNGFHWYKIGDFDDKAGDIKGVWELSRWGWVVNISVDEELAKSEKLSLLNALSSDWCQQNPHLRGPNWKCGQEVSLRLIHYLVSLRLMGVKCIDLSVSQRNFVQAHLDRIVPTLSYARGQKNNHWISEAVALIIGGLWLGAKDGRAYISRGSSELSQAIGTLFNDDGTFAQSSFNYLRHALTLISIARLECLLIDDFHFPDNVKIAKAIFLFRQFCGFGGRVTHNWGANDGSNPLSIAGEHFLDPNAHLALYQFAFGGELYAGDNAVVSKIVELYSQSISDFQTIDNEGVGSVLSDGFTEFRQGGLLFFRNDFYQALVRLPIYQFKPSQDDAGHLDVLMKKQGVAVDAGTYSYFTNQSDFEYFQGVGSHNTVYRVGSPYGMGKLSRFIFYRWSSGDWSYDDGGNLVVRFSNRFGDSFQREFAFESKRISVVDSLLKSRGERYATAMSFLGEVLESKVENGFEFQSESAAWNVTSSSLVSLQKKPVSFCYGSFRYANRVEALISSGDNKLVIEFK